LIFENDILIYKPRKLDIESGYKDILDWLSLQKIPNFHSLKACKVYSIDCAGWMEYANRRDCDNEDDISIFYRKIGQILCLTYTLGSTDLHYDNIIPVKSDPILVDLETLLGIHRKQCNYYQGSNGHQRNERHN
jgi:lantibiotic modifying enzyme